MSITASVKIATVEGKSGKSGTYSVRVYLEGLDLTQYKSFEPSYSPKSSILVLRLSQTDSQPLKVRGEPSNPGTSPIPPFMSFAQNKYLGDSFQKDKFTDLPAVIVQSTPDLVLEILLPKMRLVSLSKVATPAVKTPVATTAPKPVKKTKSVPVAKVTSGRPTISAIAAQALLGAKAATIKTIDLGNGVEFDIV